RSLRVHAQDRSSGRGRAGRRARCLARRAVRMTAAEARARFATARTARLATTTPAGLPHLVPICFALDGDTILTAIDHKPKRTTALARLRNIAANPPVALLADHYDDDDWSQLWWARADADATAPD